jgi:hypothetical protein
MQSTEGAMELETELQFMQKAGPRDCYWQLYRKKATYKRLCSTTAIVAALEAGLQVEQSCVCLLHG